MRLEAAEAIFVVGLSRSGTTLMRRVLDSHSRIAIAGENHFVGHLLPREATRFVIRSDGDLRDDTAVRRVVDRIYGGRIRPRLSMRPQSPHWDWLVKEVPREELEARLLAGERSERGLFTAIMRVYAERSGKEIMGEKSPAHLNWADTLLAWYPGGKVIHMLRDPRGVYASEVRRRLGKPGGLPYRWLVHAPPLLRLFLLIQVGLTWNRAARRHHVLASRYPKGYRLVRFEDLVREPEPTIAGVCEFLGVDVEPAMLVQKVVSRGARLGEAGFDENAAERWRAEIGPAAATWIERIVGRRLAHMGYPVGSPTARPGVRSGN